MRWHKELLFIGLFLTVRSLCSNDDVKVPKIAIIGAGIGGTSTAEFLTRLFDQNVEIDIFEKDKVAGGRLITMDIEDNLYEAGGAVIHPRNKYMKDFVELLRLEERPTSKGMKFGIWNGDEFVFIGSDVTIMADVYDIGNVSKLFGTVNSFLDNFDNIYQAQNNGLAFKNVNDLISAMNPNFPKLLQISAAEYFRSLGLSNKIIDELIRATVVENYGQDTDIHSFVSLVSVAGAGATAWGGLWSVKGGNGQVPIKLIEKNPRVNIKIRCTVKQIRYLLNEKFETQYEISYTDLGIDASTTLKGIYDVVVIATPLTKDQDDLIKFVGFPENFSQTVAGNYQTIKASFIKGDINLRHFGLEESIESILSCNQYSGFNSVSQQSEVTGGNRFGVWKVFHRPYDSPGSMFTSITAGRGAQWSAYPKYSTKPRSDEFELYDSLYHVNAIEWAASAMEMSAIGGRNVALLIHKKLVTCCQDSSVMKKKICKYSCKRQKVPSGTQNVKL